MLTLTEILRYQHCWWWHLLVIQKGLGLLQIMSFGKMDLAPLFYIVGMAEGSLLLLLRGLLAAISVVSLVLAISLVSCVNLTIVLLP
jgi:hypothetical protein